MTNGQTHHLLALTGLRFIAAFAVVVSHLSGRFYLPEVRYIGSMAVSFFFVLSGFVLTYVYRDRLKYRDIFGFYVKRLARIWPLHLVCLLIAIFGLGINVKLGLLAANGLLMQSWIPDEVWNFSYNEVSWSISTELFFYFMFPFFLIGGQKRFWLKYILTWVIAIAIVASLKWLEEGPETDEMIRRFVHTNPLLRLPEFCTGIAVAIIFQNRAQRRVSRSLFFDTILELLSCGLIIGGILTFRLHYTTIIDSPWGGFAFAQWANYCGRFWVFGLTIYVFARSNGMLAKLMGSRVLVFLGEISFALYMIHLLVIKYYVSLDWSISPRSPWLIGGLIICCCLGLSIFLFKLVEVPCRKAIVAGYAKGMKSMGVTFVTEFLRFFRSPAFILAAVLVAGSYYQLHAIHVPLVISKSARAIVSTSHYQLRNVYFGPHLRLMGFNSEINEDGVLMKFVWQKLGPIKRYRFTHFVGEDQQVLGQMPIVADLFKNAKIGNAFEETMLIPLEKFNSAHSIGIGLYSEEIDPNTNKPYGLVPIDRGPRSMSNLRLDVLDIEKIQQLKDFLKNKQTATISVRE